MPRASLARYTPATIGGYLVMGPHFSLAKIAKAIEVGILTLLLVDLLRACRVALGWSVTHCVGRAPGAGSGRSARLTRGLLESIGRRASRPAVGLSGRPPQEPGCRT